MKTYRIWVGIILLSAAVSIHAAVPPLMSYQGKLTDSLGVSVADGNYSIWFRIYDDSTGGSILWGELQWSVPVSKGLFSVLLGSVNPLLASVFGSDFSKPRTTAADFQLEVYAKSDFNMVVLLKQLAEVTRECSTNWLYDPIEGTPHLPTWLCWWKGLEPEIVTDTERAFAGQDVEFSILIRNSTGRDMENVSVTYSVEDSERNVVDNNILAIPNIEAGEIHVSTITFSTRKDTSRYLFLAISPYWARYLDVKQLIVKKSTY